MSSKRDDDFLTPNAKKIRFRGDLNFYHFDNHVEDIFDDPERRKLKNCDANGADETSKKGIFKAASDKNEMAILSNRNTVY